MRSEALLTMMLAGLLLTGCDAFQRTTIEDSAVRTHPEASEDFEFWDALAKQSVVTNNDALHGLLLLLHGLLLLFAFCFLLTCSGWQGR